VTPVDDPEYLHRNKDRHGNERIYVRRSGKYIRIREKEGTVEFHAAYVAAVNKLAPGPQTIAVTAPVKHPPGSFGWLVALYFQGKGEDEFLSLDKNSQTRRRNQLEACLEVPLADDDHEPMGNCPVKNLSAQKMKRIIEMKDGPGARTNRRKHLSALCAWAVENNHLPSNPVRDIKAGRRVKGGGFYTWTIPDVQQFLEHHRGQPSRQSKKAVLALGLLLFGGMRRQDMIAVGKQHCRGAVPNQLGDWIRYTPKKTIKKRRTLSQKPLLPVLKKIIVECAEVVGDLTFLVTAAGNAFTENGIGNWFRDRCDEAGLPMCTAHGLKKAGATIAAENGATTRQMMAMFDWDTPEMAEVYTRAAEQKRLAGQGMTLITLDHIENTDCYTLEPLTDTPQENGAKSNGQ
jgi:integrase